MPKAASKELSIPSTVTVGKIKNSARLSTMLGKMRDEGHSIQHDLFPSVNKALVEAGEGAYFAGIVVSEPQKNAVPSTLQEGEFSDTLVLKSVQGEKQTVIYYASNKGAKAKLNGIKSGSGVLIVYRGQKPSETKGFNDWHDFGIEEFPQATKMLQLVEAAE